jgi:hypothetical protein
MAHVVERAPSGRAKCRGCGKPIAKDELRFGERLPNPFAEGEMTLWFHPLCAAMKRPEPLLELLATPTALDPRREELEALARPGIEHRRLPRVDGAQRAPAARARCRACRETIARGEWRIPLVYYEEGRFQPSGYVHATCAREYFGTVALIDRVRHFAPELESGDLAELAAALDRV